jgi:hypothetical protein
MEGEEKTRSAVPARASDDFGGPLGACAPPPRARRRPGGCTQSPVDGSITAETTLILSAGNPPHRACSCRMSSSGAT